jgi:hypothetical protein
MIFQKYFYASVPSAHESSTQEKIFPKFRYFGVGLSAGYVPDQSSIGRYPNSYAIYIGNPSCNCYLAGMEHFFGWPMGGSTVKWNYQEDVIGCGLLMNPKKELAIFFTVNGILIGQCQIKMRLNNDKVL